MPRSAATAAETRTHRLLGDPSRARILQLLQDSARPLAAAEVAAETGLHATTARFHLELLADAELVSRTSEVRTTRGRPRTLYGAVPPAGSPDAAYQILAEVLLACPFIDAARRNPDLVCSVHLGLAQGVLHQLRAPVTATALRPNLDGPACLLRLEYTGRRHKQGPDNAGPDSTAADVLGQDEDQDDDQDQCSESDVHGGGSFIDTRFSGCVCDMPDRPARYA